MGRIGVRAGRVAILVVALATVAGARGQEPAPSAAARVFPDSGFDVDKTLTRPYTPDVPFGCVGNRIWASSPQGWAFGDDVHWLYLTDLRALDLEVRDEKGPLAPAQATYFPSHVHLDGATRNFTASASFTYARDKAENPLTAPHVPDRRWTAWSSGKRSDWYAVDFGAPRSIESVRVWFYDDTGRGGCRAPARVELQRLDAGEWKPIELIDQRPPKPAADENVLTFAPVTTDQIRLLMDHAGDSYYSGIYGIEFAQAESAGAESAAVELKISADKFITADDNLVVIVRVENPTAAPRVVQVMPVIDWQSQFEGRVISNHDESKPDAPSGPWALWAEAKSRLHGIDVRQALRFAVTTTPATPLVVNESRAFTVAVAKGHDDNAAYWRNALDFRYELKPGETRVFKAVLEIRPVTEASTLDAVLRPPTTFTRSLEAGSASLGAIASERQDARDVLTAHVKATQSWYDANLASFRCSDPLVEKMFYHRAYVLHKNMMTPGLGALKWPTQSEGRWRSRWYPNVISYGAAHQMREARWLTDARYWSGHLQTWANNQKANHVYPSHVTPDGPAEGQYTDWITAAAWDGHLVHPDTKLLTELADKLADNVRGWQATCDPDGDGLLAVDSHWWTGMEYQPSFFFFSEFQASNNFDQPKEQVALERVDLTVYNFGNAQTVSRIYKLIGQPDKAKEFDALAEKIAKAVAERMWQKEKQFFYSLRASDDAIADVKEIVGVYPFYFGMFTPGSGYEAAWDSILDAGQFWTPWPVASASKQCAAYSQDGWPQSDGRSAACMWNGPTWPHANSIVLTAMARTLRADRGVPKEKASRLSAEKFWELFSSFTKAQYRDQNAENPWTGEYYNGESGQWKTAERDYNHSTWLDVLIPEVIGLVPRDDEILEVDPLLPQGVLAHFTLDGQRYRGHDVTIVWDAADDETDTHGDGRSGLDVYLDGKLAASRPDLGRLQVDLKTGQAITEPAGAKP